MAGQTRSRGDKRAAGKTPHSRPAAKDAAGRKMEPQIKAALIGGVFVVVAAVIGAGAATSWFGLTASQADPVTPGVSSSGPSTSKSPGLPGTYPELADNRNGSPVYSDTKGDPAKPGTSPKIPYGTQVYVDCYASNQTGEASVTALYHVVGGEWAGQYVVSDTMSNGGALGNTDTPNVDPRVPNCK